MVDPTAKFSGSASRHMRARAFIVHQDLSKLKVTWSVESEFQQCISRKNDHSEEEQKLSHANLPL